MKTANLAIAFTQLFGFSERAGQQTLEQNQRLLSVYSELLTPLIKAFSGRVIKTIGEVFLVVFESPTQAVLCGAAIQDRVWHHNRAAPVVERMDVRVAINVGEVRLDSNDVFGEPVNIAARVQALSEAGEVYLTEAVYLAMNKSEVPAQELGAFELKGIPGRVRVFRVPKGMYRVTAAGEQDASGEQPPFGNLGLMPAAPSLRMRWSPKLPPLAQLRSPKILSIVAGVALLLFLLVRGGRSEVDSAIDAVAHSQLAERDEKAEAAQKLIASETDRARAAFDTGRLAEAKGEPREAVREYRNAAQAGHRPARLRLTELLSQTDCTTRAAAAEALGSLNVTEARSRLRELSKSGGPGDSDVSVWGITVGCDSKRAAERALRRLE